MTTPLMEQNVDEFLAHYGVKGMRWGSRKASSDGGGGGGGGGGGKPRRSIRQRIHDYNHAPDASGVSRSQARAAISKMDVQAKRDLEDWSDSTTNRSADIKKARRDLKYADRKYEDAVAELNGQRGKIGKNAARVALAKAAAEHYSVAAKAVQRTTGEQILDALFAPPPSATQDR